MPNPNPKTEQLSLGRGKRQKLNHQTVGMRMSQDTRQRLEQIALSYDCKYGGKPWIAGLLQEIASGALVVVPAPPSLPRQDDEKTKVIEPNKLIRDRLRAKHYSSDQVSESTSGEEYEENTEASC